MRRGEGGTGAAKPTSGGSEKRGEPSGAADRSKPEAAELAVRSSELPAPGLHLVATPIGNLGDISERALTALRGADRILCEDRRVTTKLLARYGIKAHLEPYHDHNAEKVRPAILAALQQGERLALVSDAGTPLLSDPGYKLVRAAIAENLPVTAEPGPSAALTALILSGLPPDRFLFAGFLPRRAAARRQVLAGWAELDATLIFYEAAPRLAASLADMVELLGARPAAVARELTKLHEEVRRGAIGELADYYSREGPPRGEIVIVIGPPEPGASPVAEDELDRRLRVAVAEFGVRDAAAKLAAETGLPRQNFYRRALAIRGER
jgi:16S rRNA (cytidine1402-2'-O)-methyltransferase